MTIQQSSTRLLNNATRRLRKAESLLIQGKYMRAEKEIVGSIAMLSRTLVRLNRSKKEVRQTASTDIGKSCK